MEPTPHELLRIMEAGDQIPQSLVLAGMAASDLETKGTVYFLTGQAWARIQPALSMEQQCSFMAPYLLECIERNPPSHDHVHSGFAAAWELTAWLKHLSTLPGTELVIEDVARQLTALFRRSDETTRNRIETGALEHLFESPRLVEYFRGWQNDAVLRDAFERALAWGQAHQEPATDSRKRKKARKTSKGENRQNRRTK